MEKELVPVIALVEDNEPDIFKDSPLRFLGYTNELGESFRPLIPLWMVRATYGIAITYAVADTIDKARKSYHRSLDCEDDHGMAIRRSIDAGLYTITWQTLASIVVPPFFINRAMAGTRYLLTRFSSVNTSTRRWICVGVGLLTIPIIFKPIDHAVHFSLENTYTKFSESFICPPSNPLNSQP